MFTVFGPLLSADDVSVSQKAFVTVCNVCKKKSTIYEITWTGLSVGSQMVPRRSNPKHSRGEISHTGAIDSDSYSSDDSKHDCFMQLLAVDRCA